MSPESAEVYGGHFTRNGHAILAIISSTKAREYDWKGIQVWEMPSRERLRKMRLAKKVIKEKNCNLIQVRNSSADGIFGLYLKWKYKVPLVFHCTWLVLGARREKVKLKIEKELCLEGLRETLDDFLQMRVMQRADLVLVPNKWVKRYLVFRGVPKNRILSFPNGVNPDLFSPKNSGMEKRREYNLGSSPVVAYVGTMDKLRRLSFLIRTFKRVKKKVKDAKLMMVGDGNDRGHLEMLTTSLGMHGDIVFTGEVPYFEVPYFLAASDIAVSLVPPSGLYKISSPLKVYEYMGAGKPVVANDGIPGHKEAIQQSGGGLLVPYDEESFANAVVELLSDPDRGKRMGRKGRKWVLENRSYGKLAKKLEGVFFDLLNLKK